ncbi:MAG TPA: hypothetical protein DCZ92_01635 [Elusimicrobia bacterium]|nr:MAG: hypothetical protein A2016_12280 [Elusimicrobia bacterium GWF2_62_30]HBA59528.1 hypothetical protein [Elusimicrobiota bacterium]
MNNFLRALAFCAVLQLFPAPAGAMEPFDVRPPMLNLSFDNGFDDEGPFGFKAKPSGDEVRLVPARAGKALFIGGTKDWLEIPLSSAVSLGGGFTLELLVKRDDWTNPYKGGSGWQTVAALTTGASLSITAPGCPLHKPWALQGSVSRYRKDVQESEHAWVLSAPYGIVPNRWFHAALVYDAPDATLELFLDGKLADTAKDAPPPDLNILKLTLGTWYQDNQAFRGYIDEVRVYDRPLRAAELAARAAAVLPPPEKPGGKRPAR